VRVALTDQSAGLAALIPGFRDAPLSYASAEDFPLRVTTREIATSSSAGGLEGADLGFLFDYRVFPPQIMRFAAEWREEDRAMREGDVVVQQVSIPPGPLAVRTLFAVRILEVFREPHRAGFSYGTLRGHAESGRSTFRIEQDEAGTRAVIETRSRPGNLPSRLLGPVFTLPYQKYCTGRALDRMRDEFLLANPA
jgi:hypothetical protein